MSKRLNQYECVFIMTPVLSEQQLKETTGKYKGIVKKQGGEMVYEDKRGLRKLAYPIQKKSTGFYHLLEFRASGEVIEQLELAFAKDERILRFLTVKLEKHGIAYNEKKRKKPARKKQEEAEVKAEAKKEAEAEEAKVAEAKVAEAKAAEAKVAEAKVAEAKAEGEQTS